MLKHVPETKIEKADRLIRRLDWKVGIEKDNKNKKSQEQGQRGS